MSLAVARELRNLVGGELAAVESANVGKPRSLSLTGGVTTGKWIAHAAADSLKRVHLELGGKAPRSCSTTPTGSR